jgi:hypothetical protein
MCTITGAGDKNPNIPSEVNSSFKNCSTSILKQKNYNLAIEKLQKKQRNLLRKLNLFKKICPRIRTDRTCACGTAPNISTRSCKECFSLISSNRTRLAPSPPTMKRTFNRYMSYAFESAELNKKITPILSCSII